MAEIYVLEFRIGMDKAWSCLACDFTPSSRRVLNRLVSVIRKLLLSSTTFPQGLSCGLRTVSMACVRQLR